MGYVFPCCRHDELEGVLLWVNKDGDNGSLASSLGGGRIRGGVADDQRVAPRPEGAHPGPLGRGARQLANHHYPHKRRGMCGAAGGPDI